MKKKTQTCKLDDVLPGQISFVFVALVDGGTAVAIESDLPPESAAVYAPPKKNGRAFHYYTSVAEYEIADLKRKRTFEKRCAENGYAKGDFRKRLWKFEEDFDDYVEAELVGFTPGGKPKFAYADFLENGGVKEILYTLSPLEAAQETYAYDDSTASDFAFGTPLIARDAAAAKKWRAAAKEDYARMLACGYVPDPELGRAAKVESYVPSACYGSMFGECRLAIG